MTDILSKEQLLLLQQNLTYEVYEQFMSMFNDSDETLPETEPERNKYILETMKNHEYWGEIHGWGENRVYCRLPKSDLPHTLPSWCGPHGVYERFNGNTKKELLTFLEEFKKYKPTTYKPTDCIPVTEEEEYTQKPMVNRWMDDSVGSVKLERHNAVDFHQ